MANVNLISARRAERVRFRKLAKGMMGGAALVAAIGVGALVFMSTQIVLANGDIAAAEEELKRLKPALDQIEADRRERAALLPKLTTLTEAQTRTKRWAGILEGLKRVTPEETWLTSFMVEKTGENASGLRLNGVASDQTRVGETMLRLNHQSEFYTKVDLRFTQAGRGQDLDRVEFELLAMLFQPEKEEAKSDDAKAK